MQCGQLVTVTRKQSGPGPARGRAEWSGGFGVVLHLRDFDSPRSWHIGQRIRRAVLVKILVENEHVNVLAVDDMAASDMGG